MITSEQSHLARRKQVHVEINEALGVAVWRSPQGFAGSLLRGLFKGRDTQRFVFSCAVVPQNRRGPSVLADAKLIPDGTAARRNGRDSASQSANHESSIRRGWHSDPNQLPEVFGPHSWPRGHRMASVERIQLSRMRQRLPGRGVGTRAATLIFCGLRDSAR